jgi:hypothetical protein
MKPNAARETVPTGDGDDALQRLRSISLYLQIVELEEWH